MRVFCANGKAIAPRSKPRNEILADEIINVMSRAPISVIFHLAGAGLPYIGKRNREYQHDANVQTAFALAKAILKVNYKGRVVASSSAAVYGSTGLTKMSENDPTNPCNDYGFAKLKAEDHLREQLSDQCDLRIARLFHIFGPGQRKLVVYDIANRIVHGQLPLVIRGTGEELRDFIFVEEAIRALRIFGCEIQQGPETGVVNICTGSATKIRDLARNLSNIERPRNAQILFGVQSEDNFIKACVGDPRRLSRLGVKLDIANEEHLLKTFQWVKKQTK